MNETLSPRQSLLSGACVLLLLWGASFALSVVWPSVVAEHCPLGNDILRPDRSVCELAFGGTWISLSIGLLAGAAATLVGLLVAALARALGRWLDAALMRSADALFALPDVLVLMVLQFTAQTAADLHPRFRISPVPLMVISLAMVGWSAPARLFRDRLETLERAEFVGAARALGAGRLHLFGRHLWPFLRDYVLAVFLARVPSAILAESTISFLGIGKIEPMSLGRYLGTSYASLLHGQGARVVLPAWLLLILIVIGAAVAGRGASALAARP
jgi:ABC-type dipeptide/oligopeptide/nickel transport system permease subunit